MALKEDNFVAISTQSLAIDTFVPMLRTLSGLLDKAAQYAETKPFDAAVLISARLAPDMLPLVKQIQIACDHAKNGTARLIGQEPPRFEDNEQTLDALKARIEKTIGYLQGISAEAFTGADVRDIVMALPRGMTLKMKGDQYIRDWALPNFYFHIITAYDILRHNGVEIGKRDYMSHVGPFVHPDSAAA
ncbi:MAG: DUF1993 domain-containing protein [Azospirillaceae bacterium]|nr:DUF1993 domain-containing protein [Azospirillaceae bacterium]